MSTRNEASQPAITTTPVVFVDNQFGALTQLKKRLEELPHLQVTMAKSLAEAKRVLGESSRGLVFTVVADPASVRSLIGLVQEIAKDLASGRKGLIVVARTNEMRLRQAFRSNGSVKVVGPTVSVNDIQSLSEQLLSRMGAGPGRFIANADSKTENPSESPKAPVADSRSGVVMIRGDRLEALPPKVSERFHSKFNAQYPIEVIEQEVLRLRGEKLEKLPSGRWPAEVFSSNLLPVERSSVLAEIRSASAPIFIYHSHNPKQAFPAIARVTAGLPSPEAFAVSCSHPGAKETHSRFGNLGGWLFVSELSRFRVFGKIKGLTTWESPTTLGGQILDINAITQLRRDFRAYVPNLTQAPKVELTLQPGVRFQCALQNVSANGFALVLTADVADRLQVGMTIKSVSFVFDGIEVTAGLPVVRNLRLLNKMDTKGFRVAGFEMQSLEIPVRSALAATVYLRSVPYFDAIGVQQYFQKTKKKAS